MYVLKLCTLIKPSSIAAFVNAASTQLNAAEIWTLLDVVMAAPFMRPKPSFAAMITVLYAGGKMTGFERL